MALQEVFSSEAAKVPDEKAAQLFAAVSAADRKAVRKLLEEGVSPDVRDENGNTPLMIAANRDDNLTIAGMLLGRGADVNAMNTNGYSVLHNAYAAGENITRLVLTFGADPLVVAPGKLREKLLFMSVASGNTQAVDALVGAGIAPDIVNTNQETLLFTAAKYGDPKMVEKMVGYGINPNANTAKGNSPLRAAMANQNPAMAAEYLECVKLILNAGADPSIEQVERNPNSDNHIDYNFAREIGGEVWKAVEEADKKFQIVRAARSGNAAPIIPLLQQGVTPDATDRYGYTGLQQAAGFNMPAELKALIDAGADPNRERPDDKTPLGHAAEKGQAANIPVLVAGGADPNAFDRKGRTALTRAIFGKQGKAGDTVKALVDSNADPNLQDKQGEYPLAFAARLEDYDAMSALIKAGAKVDLCLNKQTALLSACSADDDGKCATLLLENGADPNIVAEKTSSPLLVATIGKKAKVVEALLKKGALPDTVCEVGTGTALVQAAANGDAACVKLLLDAGADANLSAGPHARSPLHEAVRSGNFETVKLLIAAGATTFAKDEKNQTPFDYAEGNKQNYEIFEAVAARRDKELDHWAEDSIRTTGATSGMKTLKFKPKAQP